MVFQNDSAYMLAVEGCIKGKGGGARMQDEFSALLTAEAEKGQKEAAMASLSDYLADAVELGMYYDVMRFLIKGMLYEDGSFDFPFFYEMAKKSEALCGLLPFAAEYADMMRKKNEKNSGEMADFLLKTQNIFSDDFGRFLYGRMKQLDIPYDGAMTEADVDSIAKSVKKKARPGTFLCLIDYVYGGKTKNTAIFWYAMKKYILPVLGTAKFTEDKTNEQAILRSLLNQYAYYIYNVVSLSYLAVKEEQEQDDEFDPLVEYWDKDENKKSIDEAVVRFYKTNEKTLSKVLSKRTFDGIREMVHKLQ